MIKKFSSFLKGNSSFLGLIFFIVLLLNVFSIFSYNLNMILLFFSWLSLIYSWELSGNISILGALFFLFLAIVWSLFGQIEKADGITTRSFMFLVIGIIQILIELRGSKRDVMTIGAFIGKIKSSKDSKKK